MLNTPNWEESQARIEAYWQRKAADRALLSLYVPTPGEDCPFAQPEPPKDLQDQWENAPRLAQAYLWHVYHTKYLAEGFPSRFVNMGPGALSAAIGGSYKLAPHTVWFENEPLPIQDFETFDPASLKLDLQSPIMRVIEDLTRSALKTAEGRFYTTMTDLGGTLDVVAALRGTQTLLMDLYDYPDEVKAVRDRVDQLWEEMFLYIENILTEAGQTGSGSWQGIYCPRRHYPLQCDFSAMISPAQFREFVSPSLQRHCRFLENSVYHWDGPDQLCHLDALLDIPELDAIQWVPGDGNPNQAEDIWLPYYRKIQESGKNLVLQQLTPAGAKKLLSQLDHRGLWLCVNACSEEEALDVIRYAEEQAK